MGVPYPIIPQSCKFDRLRGLSTQVPEVDGLQAFPGRLWDHSLTNIRYLACEFCISFAAISAANTHLMQRVSGWGSFWCEAVWCTWAMSCSSTRYRCSSWNCKNYALHQSNWGTPIFHHSKIRYRKGFCRLEIGRANRMYRNREITGCTASRKLSRAPSLSVDPTWITMDPNFQSVAIKAWCKRILTYPVPNYNIETWFRIVSQGLILQYWRGLTSGSERATSCRRIELFHHRSQRQISASKARPSSLVKVNSLFQSHLALHGNQFYYGEEALIQPYERREFWRGIRFPWSDTFPPVIVCSSDWWHGNDTTSHLKSDRCDIISQEQRELLLWIIHQFEQSKSSWSQSPKEWRCVDRFRHDYRLQQENLGLQSNEPTAHRVERNVSVPTYATNYMQSSPEITSWR